MIARTGRSGVGCPWAHRISILVVLAVLWVLVPACSKDTEDDNDNSDAGDTGSDVDADSDADTDTDSDTDSDAGTDSDPLWNWQCPAVPDGGAYEPCDGSIGELTAFQPILAAEELDGSVAFIAPVGTPSLILAERTVGDVITPVVITVFFGADLDAPPIHGEFGLLEPSAEPLRARGAIGAHYWQGDWEVPDTGLVHVPDVLGYSGIVLLCGESVCTLYGVVEEEGVPSGLSPLPGGEVPLANPISFYWLLAVEETNAYGAVCAYGDGIACFDGESWSTVLGPDDETILLAGDVEYRDGVSPDVILVDDANRLHFMYPDGFEVWEVPEEIGSLSVSWFGPYLQWWGGRYFVVGGNERIVLGMSTGASAICQIPGESFPVVFGHEIPNYLMEGQGYVVATLFTQAGEVLEVAQGVDEGAPWLCAMGESPMGTPRATGRWEAPGESSVHQFLLTETGLYTRQVRGSWEP